MRYAASFAALIFLWTGPAAGQFLGGYADGAAEADRLDLQRRALELDRRDGGSRTRRLMDEHRDEELRRLLEENNRLLRDIERRRLIEGRP